MDAVEDAAMVAEDTIADTETGDEATTVAVVLRSLPVFLRRLSFDYHVNS